MWKGCDRSESSFVFVAVVFVDVVAFLYIERSRVSDAEEFRSGRKLPASLTGCETLGGWLDCGVKSGESVK